MDRTSNYRVLMGIIKRYVGIIIKIFFNRFIRFFGIIFVCCISQIASTHNSTQQNDVKVFSKVFEDQDWDVVINHFHAKNKTVSDFAVSQKLLNSDAQVITLQSIVNFVQNNPYWIYNPALVSKAEKIANLKNNSPKLLLHWFTKYPPNTHKGYEAFMHALENTSDTEINKLLIIRKSWRQGIYSTGASARSRDKSIFLKKYQKYIKEYDHLERINNLLWLQNYKEAKATTTFLPYKKQKLLKKYISYISGEKSIRLETKELIQVMKLCNELSYHYLNLNKDEFSQLKLIMLQSEISLSNYQKQWWTLKAYYFRLCLKNKQFLNAYNIVSSHSVDDAVHISESQWLSGWVALRFLHNPALSLKHFNKMAVVVKKPISIARVWYWIGRAHKAMNNLSAMQQAFQRAACYPMTFYGNLSTLELGDNSKIFTRDIAHLLSHKDAVLHSQQKETLYLIDLLLKSDQQYLAVKFAKNVVSRSQNAANAAKLLHNISLFNNAFVTVEAAKSASYRKFFTLKYGYPQLYTSNNMPLPLLHSIIRQESVFDQYAISSAEAMGLMQVRPATECDYAKSIGQKCNKAKLIEISTHNIESGIFRFYQLLKKYNGAYVLAIAAYNAGPTNVNKWLECYGDPRKMKELYNVIDWLELVPFYETRNYIQRVLENLQVYDYMYNSEYVLSLQDILMVDTE